MPGSSSSGSVAPNIGTSGSTPAPGPALPDLRPTISTTQPPASGPTSLSGTISVQQALDQTLIYGPRAASARSLVGISKAAITQAKVYPNPALEFDNGYAEFSYRFGIAVPVEPRENDSAHRRRQSAGGTATIQMEQSLWLLRADIRRAYTELVVAQNR